MFHFPCVLRRIFCQNAKADKFRQPNIGFFLPTLRFWDTRIQKRKGRSCPADSVAADRSGYEPQEPG